MTPEHIVLVAESIAISVDKLSACQDLRSRYAPVEGKVEDGITIAAFENVSTGVVLDREPLGDVPVHGVGYFWMYVSLVSKLPYLST